MVMVDEKIKVTQIRSTNKKLQNHKACVRGLGLRHIGHSIVISDTPENRGMINKVNYLLNVEKI